MEEVPPQIRHQLAQFNQAQQQAQALTTQKQQLQLALRETERAIGELEKLDPGDTVYKSIGGILVKADRESTKKDLGERKETLELRIKTLERQEERVIKRLNEMRDKIQEMLRARKLPPGAG